jgi:hypothetical protein
MRHLSAGHNAEGRERLEKYYELRRQGLGIIDAAAAIEVLDHATVYRYERWFKAIESGTPIVPGKLGRPA